MDIPGLKRPGLTTYEQDKLYQAAILDDFKKLHNDIVESIIYFCQQYDIDCDEVMLEVSEMHPSIYNYGNIGPLWNSRETSSGFVLAKYNENTGQLETVLKSRN